MNFKQIFLFFIKDTNGKLKLSLISSFFGLFIGTYSIFMIMSIMNGIENNFLDRINSYHYKYFINHNTLSSEMINKNDFNPGYEKIALLNKTNLYSNVIGFKNIEEFYKSKISKYTFIDNKYKLKDSDIIIGQNIANRLNLNIGDSLLVSYPSDINIASGFVTSKYHRVYGIFNISFLNFNSSIFTNIENLNINDNIILKYFYDDLKFSNNIKYNENNVYSNLIIDGLNLEKKAYYFFAFFAIVLSCFILFSTMVLSINEKTKQFIVLNILGMKIRDIISKLFFLNCFVSSIIVIFTIFLVNGSLFLYKNYNLLGIIYNPLPFFPDYISFENIETFILSFIIIVIISFFSTLPLYYLDKDDKYVRF